MSRRNIFIALFVLVIALALMLRDAVESVVILPAAYLWWQFKLYYAALPQVIFWVLMIAAVFYYAIVSLIPETRPRGMYPPELKSPQGQIEILADWLNKSRRGGMYHKWLIANRLGKAARELLAQRDGQGTSKRFAALSGRGWNPAREIQSYLDVGLNGSFANFPRPRWFWQSPPPTPLDLDPQQALDYLEDEMETRHG